MIIATAIKPNILATAGQPALQIKTIEAALRGPPGKDSGSTLTMTALQALGGHRVVYAVDGSYADYASSSQIAQFSQVLGITTGASATDADTTIQRAGPLSFEGWAWATGPVFLGENGQLTQTLDPAARFSLSVGFAMSATNILVDIGMPIILEL